MEENKKLFIAALVVIFGGNASGIVSAFNPDANNVFTSLDAAKLEAKILASVHEKCEANENEHDLMEIRMTVAEFKIKECVRKVGP